MGRGDEEGKIHGMGSVKRGESRWRRVEVRERGGGGGCSNERNLHDFACFSASWLRPSGFSFLPTFSACFSGCSHPATQERGRRREEEEEEKEGVASRCELLRGGRGGTGDGKLFFLVFLGGTVEYRWAAKKKGGKESFEGVVLSGWREIIGKNLPYRHVRMTNNWNGEAAFSVPSFSKLDLTRI